MKAVFNLLKEWKNEQLNNQDYLKLSRIDFYSVVFVIGFLSTIFLCLLGVIQLAYVYLDIGSLIIFGYDLIPAWIPAISALVVSIFGFLGLHEGNNDASVTDVETFGINH